MKYPSVTQRDPKGCGPASLQAIGEFHNVPIVLPKPDSDGTSLSTLRAAAESAGFQTRCLRAEHKQEALSKLSASLVHFPGHWVVAWKADNNRVLVNDPDPDIGGFSVLSIEEFCDMWDGIFMTVTKTEENRA